MTIMFAGGITVAGSSFAFAPYVPEAIADHSDDATTDGLLSVSSTHVMGGAVVEITLTDPAIDDIDQNITPPEVTFDDQNVDMTQMSDGTWVAYVVDHESSLLNDGGNPRAETTGIEYGILCAGGLGSNTVDATNTSDDEETSGHGNTNKEITTNDAYVEISHLHNMGQGCTETNDQATAGGGRVNMSILEDPDTINQNSNQGTNSTGQRDFILNSTTNLGAWPFIQAINFTSSNTVAYGSDEVEVEWGDHTDMRSITIDREVVPDNAEILLTITDPGLNYDPTSEDVWIMDAAQGALYFYNNGTFTGAPESVAAVTTADTNNISRDGVVNPVFTSTALGNLGCGDNCLLTSGGNPKAVFGSGGGATSYYSYANVTLTETGDNTGVFTTFDAEDGSGDLQTATNAGVDSQMTFSYDGDTVTLVIGYHDSEVTFDAGDAWLPVETATYTITDPDMNKNTMDQETLDISDPHDRIPTVTIGSPLTLADNITSGENRCSVSISKTENVCISSGTSAANDIFYDTQTFNATDNSKRVQVNVIGAEAGFFGGADATTGHSSGILQNTITWVNVTTGIQVQEIVDLPGSVYVSYDIRSIADQLSSTDIDAYFAVSPFVNANGSTATGNKLGDAIPLVSSGNTKAGIFDLDAGTGDSTGAAAVVAADTASQVGVEDELDAFTNVASSNTAGLSAGSVQFIFQITHPAAKTLASNGTCNSESCYGEYAIAIDIINFDIDNASDVHNAIYRLEAEETGDNTGVFSGEVTYAILNTANATNSGACSSGSDPAGTSGFCYGGHDGSASPSSGAPGLAPAVNDDELLILLTSGADGTSAPRVSINDSDTVGSTGNVVGIQLDAVDQTGTAEFDLTSYGTGDTATITIVDADLNQDNTVRETYTNASQTFQIVINDDDSQLSADQVVIETSADSGTFIGTFVVPDQLGTDMELQYYDAVDATGGDSTTYATAAIASNLGDVSLDRTSYPVPYLADKLNEGDNTVMASSAGNVVATISVTDPDNSADSLTTNSNLSTHTAGTIKVKLGGTYVYTAGAPRAVDAGSAIEELGPLAETERDSQVYEVDFEIGGTTCSGGGGTGNAGTCQAGISSGTPVPVNATTILQVEYIDTADAAGGTTTLYDSAIFELHTGSLSVDKDVYVMGQDAVLTLTDLDLNLDADEIEQYDLRLIEWDSDNNSSVLLHNSYCTSGCTLDPSNFTETGDNTGVFQTVFTIPTSMSEQGAAATSPEQGDDVTLTYRDVGLSGENSYGDDELDIEASFSISNFGAIVELDKAVYDWTDTVIVTITAPDWNQNSNSEETIGTAALSINANTRNGKMCNASTDTDSSGYTLNETDENTGVFDGEIALAGFSHTMASSQSYTATDQVCDGGNKAGILQTAGNMDGITVSYEWVDGSIAIASAIIQWNIGEVEILDSSVSPNGSTIVRVTDVDEDLSSTVIDTFKVDVFSDSDSGGFQATVSETGEDTGIFEAIIYFSDSMSTSGLTLRVAEGDTVTAEYTDVTLPGPDYTTSDDLTIAATTTIGTSTPPLERAPAANARVVDAFGSSVAEVSVDQQVQIAADVSNAQGKEQAFAYLVQVQDANGVTVSLAWITGSLNAGQSMSPALSWTPSASGSYTATVFVWESVDNPVALSPTVSVGIDVV
jgi:hypothetical protein